jgi:predicted methyltransferase
MGSGGDFNSIDNSYNSFCEVCNGTGIMVKQVTRQREYIEFK